MVRPPDDTALLRRAATASPAGGRPGLVVGAQDNDASLGSMTDMWVVDGRGIAHFLFHDGVAARAALRRAGIAVLADRQVLIQPLKQDVPGQLGELTARMAEAGVNIEVQYSDHAGRLILVVDDPQKGGAVSEAWTMEQLSRSRADGLF
jgi:hypothetical protein